MTARVLTPAEIDDLAKLWIGEPYPAWAHELIAVGVQNLEPHLVATILEMRKAREAMPPASLSDLIADIKKWHDERECYEPRDPNLWEHDQLAALFELAHEHRGKLLDALQASQPCGAAGDVTSLIERPVDDQCVTDMATDGVPANPWEAYKQGANDFRQLVKDALLRSQPRPAGEAKILHASDCAVNNRPALPAANCDCGAQAARDEVANLSLRSQPTAQGADG